MSLPTTSTKGVATPSAKPAATASPPPTRPAGITTVPDATAGCHHEYPHPASHRSLRSDYLADLSRRVRYTSPEGEIICSFPAAKEMRAATILGAMGAPVAAFRSDKALRRHLGWSVEEERSGSSVAKERLSRSGNRHSRREMRLWTLGLISPRTPWTPFRGPLRPPGRSAERQAAECRPGAPRLQADLGDVRLHGAQRALRREASGEGHGHRDREAGEGLRLALTVVVDQGLSSTGQ